VSARAVLRYPDPALKRTAVAPRGCKEAEQVARDLLDTMRAHAGCVGLAAPQIDEHVRIVAVDVSAHPRAGTHNGPLVLVAPVVSHVTGAEVAREGCLSIPDLTANVRRATEIVVEAHELDGNPVRIESRGFEARCLLHEIDHLDGILFLDRVDSLKRDVFRRKRYAQQDARPTGGA
jgi:peptide deformylase